MSHKGKLKGTKTGRRKMRLPWCNKTGGQWRKTERDERINFPCQVGGKLKKKTWEAKGSVLVKRMSEKSSLVPGPHSKKKKKTW